MNKKKVEAKKEWQEKKIEENDALKREISYLQSDIVNMKKELAEKEEEINRLIETIRGQRKIISFVKRILNGEKASPSSKTEVLIDWFSKDEMLGGL